MFERPVAGRLVALCVAWVGLPCGAQAASISGLVRDAERGNPLPFASIVLHRNAAPDSLAYEGGKMGGRDGRYRFDGIPAGAYEIRVAYVAYRARVDTVQVGEGADAVHDIALTPAPIGVEKIVVDADRLGREKSAQTSVVNLDMKRLAAVPSIGEADPIRALQLLPGVQAASDVSSGLYIRGGGPDQTLVLLDDITMYNPTHAFGFFSTFNPDVVDRVTLYKGAYPADQGGRLGAVVDIKTRTPAASKVQGAGSISTIASRLTLDGPIGRDHWLLSGRRSYLEPILSGLRRSTPEVPFYNFYDFNAKYAMRRDNNWVDTEIYKGRDNLRIEPDRDTRLTIRWGNTAGAVVFSRVLSKDALLKSTISGSEYESLTDANLFNTAFNVTNSLRDLTARTELHLERATHALGVGGQVSLYDFKFSQSFNRDKPVGFRSQPAEIAAYVDDQWTPQAVTTIRTGLRTRYISDGKRLLLEPRLSVSRALGDKLRLKFGSGVYNQYLQLVTTEGFSAGDLYVPIDASTQPGRSLQAVFGAEYETSPRYRFSAETYYTRLTHLVEFTTKTVADRDNFTARDLFDTGGTGYATGLELFAERRAGRVTGWLGYALGWSRRRFDALNGGKTYPPKYDRRHDLKAVLAYQRSPWSYSASFLFATGQAFTPASARYQVDDPALGDLTPGSRVLAGDRNSSRLLPYHRMDFSVTRDFALWGRSGQWFVQFFNLYSRRNEWFVQFDDQEPKVDVVRMLPIIPSFGASFKF